jgi:hypothetical protein
MLLIMSLPHSGTVDRGVALSELGTGMSDRPDCIRGCKADHAAQSEGMRECGAYDHVGTVLSSVDSLPAIVVQTSRWRDRDGVGAEVVVYPPAHDGELLEPLTLSVAGARMLAALLHRAADLGEHR